jgi:hypothetical protein
MQLGESIKPIALKLFSSLLIITLGHMQTIVMSETIVYPRATLRNC